MSSPIYLIIGLANPGKAYEHTRHNAGAWFVEKFAQTMGAHLRFEAKFHGLYAYGITSGYPYHLLIPMTYMNRSGLSVQACMHYHKVLTSSLLVVHDDIDLAVGTIRLKYDGGDGGHNGLKDIIRHLNTKQFYRLRIGVGRPPSQNKDIVDYVLHPPSKVDRDKINVTLDQALDIIPLLLEGKSQQAMQQLHTPQNSLNQHKDDNNL